MSNFNKHLMSNTEIKDQRVREERILRWAIPTVLL